MSSPRARELFGLLPVSLLVTAGFTAVLLTRTEDVSNVTVTYGAVFLGLVGEAQDQPFFDLMAGLEPLSDEPLGRQFGEGLPTKPAG